MVSAIDEEDLLITSQNNLPLAADSYFLPAVSPNVRKCLGNPENLLSVIRVRRTKS